MIPDSGPDVFCLGSTRDPAAVRQMEVALLVHLVQLTSGFRLTDMLDLSSPRPRS